MITTSNITMQFGAKPLFENVSVKFGDGNRYGLIGANGCGKSTFMKIMGGDLEPSAGNVSLDPGVRLGKLKQDQFAYEDQRVVDVVLQGHTELWEVMQEKDAIYANPEATEDDYMRAADLEVRFGEMGGYDAEARAGSLLLGVGIPVEQHFGPMSEVAPGWKLRVLLAQALFSNPDVLLLDEPTNNLDINTIRWLEQVINERESTMVIISHDRHFLNEVCTHIADLDYNTIRVYPGNYDDYMEASLAARERQTNANAKAKERIAELNAFAARFAANKSKARQATSRLKLADKIKSEMVEVKPSSRQNPYIRFEMDDRQKLHRQAFEMDHVTFGYDQPLFKNLSMILEAGQKLAVIGGNGAGKTTFIRTLVGELKPQHGTVKWAEKAEIGYFAQDHAADFDTDLGVLNADTGLPLVYVASGPTTGQYTVNPATGVYTFAAADTGDNVLITYAYASTGGQSMTIENTPIGNTPTFQLDYCSSLYGKSYYVRMFACVSNKLTRSHKLTDYMMPEIDFGFFATAAGLVYRVTYPEIS